MKATNRFWRYLLLPLSFAGMLSISSAAELNPAAVIYKLPDQIPWGPVTERGAQSAVLVGDPTKAHQVLGWQREVDFPGLVTMMVNADMDLVRNFLR